MRSRIVSTSLGILSSLAWGFYPLLAQQMGPQPVTPQWGQTPTPQLGTQPSNSAPQGMVTTPGLQPSDLSQVSRRHCGGFALVQPPSAPLRPGVPGPSQTIPVQGPWLGSPGTAGVQEAGNVQPASSQIGSGRQQVDSVQPQGPTSAPKSGIDQPAQFPSQSFGSTYPGQFFFEPLSTIEAAYQTPIFPGEKPKDLRQYGYSLFASPISTFAPVEDVPVGPDYILGPGDNLTVNIWGAMEGAAVRTVDRNGQIVLPSVGPVMIWGLSFSQADQLIREQLSRYYRGFQTNVTMGRLRTIRVYIVGEVCQPGSFTLSSLSTVTNALFAAGGSLKLGSLRHIALKRNHHEVGTLDLYDFLLRGDKTQDFRLESGDTIFVPPIGPIAAIEGEVKRPAIYELKGPTRVSDLIEMAGGLTPRSYLKRVQVIRSKPNAEREVIDLDLTSIAEDGGAPKNIELKNGDLVRIYPTDPRIYNTVNLTGAVKHSGEYELKEGMRLSQILRRENLLPEAYLERVEIARLKEDLTTEVIQVDLKKAWSGDEKQDLPLRARDYISVRTEYRSPWKVTLEGEVRRPGVYTVEQGERLSSVFNRAGGFTDKAYLKGALFTREAVKRIEEEQLKNFFKAQEERVLALAGTMVVQGADKAEAAQTKETLDAQRELLRSLATKVAVGRVVIKLDELEKFERSNNDVALEDGDRLFVPSAPSSIAVLGAVRSSTSVLYKEGEGMEYYLNRAGGLTKQADQKEIYIAKADGSALTGFTKLRKMEPGDAIIVPPKEEERYRWLPVTRDWVTILSQTLISIAAISVLF